MGSQDPRLSSTAKRERSTAKDKGTGGQYVAVCSVFNSPITHNPFVTLSPPFRIKCERYIFLKKCVRSSLLLIMFPHGYVYGCDYTTKQFYLYQFNLVYVIICTLLKCQTVLLDPQIGPFLLLLLRVRGDLGVMTMKRYSTFPNLQVRSLTIRLFNDISRKLVGGGSYFSAEMQLVYTTAPTDCIIRKKI